MFHFHTLKRFVTSSLPSAIWPLDDRNPEGLELVGVTVAAPHTVFFVLL
jgi:hypothetical protein